MIPLCVLAGIFPKQARSAEEVASFRIVEAGHKWQLLHNGNPLYIKGAVAWRYFGVLKDCGANSVRTQASKRHLDQASKHGLSAMAGLPVRGERNGMDWSDERMISAQRDRILTTVRELRGHPALMFWAVGNELDWIPPGRPHHPRLWDRLNDIAVEIKKIDPDHPVLTVVGTGRFELKIQEIAEHCTAFDLLGINTYGDIDEVTTLTKKYWPKPYVIAEWGPTGHWQAPRTQWRVSIEQTSSEKAQAIFHRYTSTIWLNRDQCLGSYVFFWDEKQETTHTWYGMFREGSRTESIDVMEYLWTGSWPANRAPAVLELHVEGFEGRKQVYLKPGQACRARVACYDSDYDVLRFVWDIRPEVEIPADSYAGSQEKPAKPIPGLIRKGDRPQAEFTAPAQEGPYRLFVQVSDDHSHAGYANVPFYVKSP